MFGNDIFTRVKRSENKKMAEIAQFLHENDLSVDTTVEVFITVTRDEKLIACGGIAGNIIKCVAISESVRGEGLALTLATELINPPMSGTARICLFIPKPNTRRCSASAVFPR